MKFLLGFPAKSRFGAMSVCTTYRVWARRGRTIPIGNLRVISGKARKSGNIGQNRRKSPSVLDGSHTSGNELEPARGRLSSCSGLAVHALHLSTDAWRKLRP